MNPERRKKIHEYVKKVADGAADITAVDRTAIKAKVDALYEAKLDSSQIRSPHAFVKVIWCESPFQQMVMPVLLEIAMQFGRSSELLTKLRDHLTLPLWARALDSLLDQISDYEFDKLRAYKKHSLRGVANNLRRKSWLNCEWPTIGRASEASSVAWDNPPFFGTRNLVEDIVMRLSDDPELMTEFSRQEGLFSGSEFTVKNQVLQRLQSSVEPFRRDNSRWLYLLELLHWIAKGENVRLKINQESIGFKLAPLIEDELNKAFGHNAFTQFSDILTRRSTHANNSLILNLMLGCTLRAVSTSQANHQFVQGLLHYIEDPDRNGRAKVAWAHMDLVSSVYAFSAFEKVCFVCDNVRKVSVDDRGRAHSDTAPAIEFPDGYKLFAWHGTIVEQDIIEHPESITIKRIDSERNAEVRRVLIERYSAEKYIMDSDAYLRDADYCGNLYSKALPGDEPLVMVEVTNSTPEPDGTLKRYFLRVPPDTTTAREAVAWTFGMSEDEYFPLKET